VQRMIILLFCTVQ